MEQNPSREFPLPVIARRAAMSTRTLSRRFREQVGATPAAWLAHAHNKADAFICSSSSGGSRQLRLDACASSIRHRVESGSGRLKGRGDNIGPPGRRRDTASNDAGSMPNPAPLTQIRRLASGRVSASCPSYRIDVDERLEILRQTALSERLDCDRTVIRH
jgi:hypothetical protein